MFEEIKQLLTEFKATKKQSVKALIVENLKNLQFFQNQMSVYGVSILLCYIPLLETYVLRAGMEIINNESSYVVVEGCVQCTICQVIPVEDTYKKGMEVEIPFDKEGHIVAVVDSKLLKIGRKDNPKAWSELGKMEREKIGRNREYTKAMKYQPELLQCKELVEKIQLFDKMGNFDLTELIVESKYLTLAKGSVTHQADKLVNSLGFVLSGKIKLIHNEDESLNIEGGRKIMSKYFSHHKKTLTHNYISYLQTGECIGLEQYLWETTFKSSGEVLSRDAKILYIPENLFAEKFNETVNYGLMSKLCGLVNAKKNIKDKSVKSKRQKQLQMIYEVNQAFAKKKMDELYNIASKDPGVKMRFRHNKSPIFPKQCYMPERLTHKVKVYEQKYSSLPKIKDRINLFPEEYEKAIVPIYLKNQLKDKQKSNEKKRKRSISPKNMPQPQNPDKILQRILDTIASTNPENKGDSFSRTKTKQFIEVQTKYHPNRSIFNNFRVSKNKGEKFSQSLYRTLEID